MVLTTVSGKPLMHTKAHPNPFPAPTAPIPAQLPNICDTILTLEEVNQTITPLSKEAWRILIKCD